MTKRRIILTVSISAAILCVLIWSMHPKELVYEGKRVSEWVEIYCRNGSNATLHFTAVCNLIDLGTNSIPCIVDMASIHDSPIKKALVKIPVPQKLLEFMKLKGNYDRWVNAASERPVMAARAFLLVGRKNVLSVPALVPLLSVDNPVSRIAAANMLLEVGHGARDAVPLLLSLNMNDPDPKVRGAAGVALRGIQD